MDSWQALFAPAPATWPCHAEDRSGRRDDSAPLAGTVSGRTLLAALIPKSSEHRESVRPAPQPCGNQLPLIVFPIGGIVFSIHSPSGSLTPLHDFDEGA